MKFLLELASEEIPARMQAAAASKLADDFFWHCAAAGLTLDRHDIVADATPRRLWLVACDMPAASGDVEESIKGPRADAPAQAIEGFLKKTGLKRDQLVERDTGKGMALFAMVTQKGRPTFEILAEVIPQIVRDFQWPRSMRWGAASVSPASPRWVRPLTGIVALLDGEVVACEAHGVAAGRTTRGHRIHAPVPISIESADTYAAQLLAAKVIVSSAKRRAVIEAKAAEAAAAKGLSVIPDAGLVAENAGLTEWPVPMLGSFDPAFLAVPREVIQLTMRTNQKYFACADSAGALAPAFVCVANLEASDGGVAIVKGNERVLSARLSDAKFFWDQDVATVKAGGLEAFVPKLSDIVFHEKLGTVADKVERVAKLARWLVESGAVKGDAALAEQAAKLCKADLVSATVGEFPEVQGIAGAYLARVAGLDRQVADAIRDHYKPVGQGDDVPTTPVSVAVALADKLDTIAAFFAIGEIPTGSRDPYAIRRAALGSCSLILNNALKISLRQTLMMQNHCVRATLFQVKNRSNGQIFSFEQAFSLTFVAEPSHPRRRPQGLDWSAAERIALFLGERIAVQQRDKGVRLDLIEAVMKPRINNELYHFLIEDNLVRLLQRVEALQNVIDTYEGIALQAGLNRALSILDDCEKDGALPVETEPSESLFAEHAERNLYSSLCEIELSVRELSSAGRFVDAMHALAAIRPKIDEFFENVLVNDKDAAIRLNRLRLLAKLRRSSEIIADFSRIKG